MKNKEIPSQLRWSCRRGMLELDVLLGNFLEEVFLDLSLEDQEDFKQLLDNNDQDLFTWLTGRAVPTDSGLARLVAKIRTHAQHRH